jgi:hypothetical protein
MAAEKLAGSILEKERRIIEILIKIQSVLVEKMA